MKTVCEKNMCTGCKACINTCKFNAIKIIENLDAYNAFINSELCISCKKCYHVCPYNNPSQYKLPEYWWQGWSKNDRIRENSSSGGIAAELEQQFIKEGGIVCSCLFENGKFEFSFAESLEGVRKFKGSKYVKSDPGYIYQEIQKKLEELHKVLFVGLPCQVSALLNFIDKKYRDSLYTIDLICHGTPSPMILEKFVNQYNYMLSDFSEIAFREKTTFGLRGDNIKFEVPKVLDNYSMAFLSSLSYTENCYFCKYAQLKRVSDITLGDSWGSKLPIEEQKKGVSLILCQTQKGYNLLNRANLKLLAVDKDNAIKNNSQLIKPSTKPHNRNLFFSMISRGESFNKAVIFCCYFKHLKQVVKRSLVKIAKFVR